MSLVEEEIFKNIFMNHIVVQIIHHFLENLKNILISLFEYKIKKEKKKMNISFKTIPPLYHTDGLAVCQPTTMYT